MMQMVQTQTNQNGATATRKTSKKRASKVDTVPCGVCKVRKCDDEYSRSWISASIVCSGTTVNAKGWRRMSLLVILLVWNVMTLSEISLIL